MEKKDIPNKVKWVNDEEVRKTLFITDISEIGTEQWLSKVASDGSRRDYIVFDSQTNKPIGFSGIDKIDYVNSKAETYFCIGEKEYRGIGLGTDVMTTITKHCFIDLRLNKVYLYTWTSNIAMVKVSKRVGFTMEGTLRQNLLSNGVFKDTFVFSMLKSEFFKQYTF